MLFIGTLEEPLISSGFIHIPPKRDKPREFTISENFIYLNVKEIWLYNQRTGEVLTKIKSPGTSLGEK